jgi:RNA polymerase sigma factor (sigma-70 family)
MIQQSQTHIGGCDGTVAERTDEAFNGLVRAHEAMVRATCVRQLGRQHVCIDDAVQATFIVYHRKIRAVRLATTGAWLHRVASGICHQILREEGRRKRRERLLDTPSPAEPVAPELLSQLDLAIDGLPSTQRVALVAHYLHGKPQAVVAGELGISEGAVKKRVADGIASLRRFFARHDRAVGTAALTALLCGIAEGADIMMESVVLSGRRARTTATSIMLAKGMLKTMFLKKTVLFSLIATVVIALSTGLIFAQRVAASDEATINKAAMSDSKTQTTLELMITSLRTDDFISLYKAMPSDVRIQLEREWDDVRSRMNPQDDADLNSGLELLLREDSASFTVASSALSVILQANKGKLIQDDKSTGLAGALLDAIDHEFQSWLASRDYSDIGAVRAFYRHIQKAVRAAGVMNAAEFRALPFAEVCNRGGPVLRAVKDAMAVYGFDLDGILASVVISSAAERDGHYMATVVFSAFGTSYTLPLDFDRIEVWRTCLQVANPMARHFHVQISH